MRSRFNLYITEYAINSLLRQRYKTLFIFFILSALVFLLSSLFFITNSIKHELNSTVDSLPEITIQKIKAGRQDEIGVEVVDEILQMSGVQSAVARVWGYYYFENAGVNFTLVGIDEYEEQYKESLNSISQKLDFESSVMMLGEGVKRVMKKSYYKEYFNFIKPEGTMKRVYIGASFEGDTELESNDVIVMSKKNIREIFGIDETKATDIVAKVANPNEIATIASKIKLLYPDARVITKDDLKISYQNIFDYKSGVFLALFIVSLFTFFIIIYDKASGLSSEEKREIGILKALGWRIDDVLKERFYEGFIVSFFSYITGIILALFFVYILKAPLMQNIFIGYSQLKTSFTLPFVLDWQSMALIFFLSVPVYIAATIVPAYRSATLEVDEVIR
ncbi:FtsX-like permease family protein [Sulfurimonas crateris]|uniref:FtsX-like permease family protein n=1 Tax=Sulfurimonas crateris TaxID=2574727 RepID=A0A4U2Z613_9BACT|nr:FtsX-like permease family protein [Sulfurimonas crateris]TKI69629.1 FtsX-like permease family protein [Sulfurimonas crateris]